MSRQKILVRDESLRKLAEKVVRAYSSELGYINLQHVLFYLETGLETSDFNAECRKVTSPWDDILADNGVQADWIITFFSCNTEGKSANWMALVMLHELMHIGADGKIVRHDREDFASLLRAAGVDWGLDGGDLPNILKKKVAI